MSILGLQEPVVEDGEAMPYEVAAYEEEVALGQMSGGEIGESTIRQRGTKQVRVPRYDWFGNLRMLPRGAINYYDGKMRLDPKTGKVRKVFTVNPPAHLLDKKTGKLKELAEGTDFIQCKVCPTKIQIDQKLRALGLTAEQRKEALDIAEDTHYVGFHPDMYVHFGNPAILAKRMALAKK